MNQIDISVDTSETTLLQMGISDVKIGVLKNVDQNPHGDQLAVEIVHNWGTIEVHADGRIVANYNIASNCDVVDNEIRWRP